MILLLDVLAQDAVPDAGTHQNLDDVQEFENIMSSRVYILKLSQKPAYAAGVRLRYNYRLYPTPGQQIALARVFGCVRVVFNDGLRARQDAYKAGQPYVTDAELSARLTAKKATPERAWLGEVSAVPLQQSLASPKIEPQLGAR